MKSYIGYKITRKVIGLLSRHLIFSKIVDKISKEYQKKVIKHLSSQHTEIISKYQDINMKKKNIKNSELANVIWIFWLQGFEEAPDIVKQCKNSLFKHNSEFKIVTLNRQNYKDYANLPNFITEKFKKGEITIQKFANIIRLYLLKEYGGLWVDATIYFNNRLEFKNYFNDLLLYRRNENPTDLVRFGMFSTFFMGTRIINDPLFSFVYEMHIDYWKKNSTSIDYFLFDYIFELALIYNIGAVKTRYEYLNSLNWNVFDLHNHRNQLISLELDKKLFNEHAIWYKMSYRFSAEKILYKKNDETFWNKIIRGDTIDFEK